MHKGGGTVGLDIVQRVVSREERSTPRRSYQSMVYFEGKIYMWGGVSSQKQNPATLFFFDFHANQWKNFVLAAERSNLNHLSGMCSTLCGSQWFLFGGSTPEGELSNCLYRIGLNYCNRIENIAHKGAVPPASECGCLCSMNQKWLIHYPGLSPRTTTSDSVIYAFKIATMDWVMVANAAQSIRFRLCPGMCIVKQEVYLFGGVAQDGDQLQHLSDFYVLKTMTRDSSRKFQSVAKSIPNRHGPQARQNCILQPITNRVLCVMGGMSEESVVFQDLWFYDIALNLWVTEEKRFISLNRLGWASIYSFGSFIIFGGSSQETSCDMYRIELSPQKVVDKLEEASRQGCELCSIKKKAQFIGGVKPGCKLLRQAHESLDFQFSAFGLLMDNSMAMGATRIYITVLHRHNPPLLLIEDNGVFPWEVEDLFPALWKCQVPNHVILDSWQKKIKKDVDDQNGRKEFGTNLKLGCLRLGSGFIWMCVEPQSQNRHVALCQQLSNGQVRLTYYCILSQTGQVREPWMQSGRQEVEKRYYGYLSDMLQRKNMNNSLMIFGTHLNQPGSNLRFSQVHNDIVLGEESTLNELERRGYRVDQCIDISLRTYLSLLYLQIPQVEGIYLGSMSRPTKVHIQLSIEIVDQLCKEGHLVQVQNVLEFELKMSEIYLLKAPLATASQFFSNGLLIYCRNRLIVRHHPPLGELPQQLLLGSPTYYNHLPFLGYLEVPQTLPANIFKNDFTFPVMTNALHSRIKFVEQSLTKRLKFLLAKQTGEKSPKRPKKSAIVESNIEEFIPTRRPTRGVKQPDRVMVEQDGEYIGPKRRHPDPS